MRRLLPLVVLTFAASSGAFTSAHRPVQRAPAARLDSTTRCLDSTVIAGQMIAYLADLATTTDSSKLAMRTRASLGAVSATDVVLVSDTALCRRASESLRFAKFNADTGPLWQVHLIRYGATRYVGSSLMSVGEWIPWTVFDTTFARIIAFTY
jgi:hypothetical protein